MIENEFTLIMILLSGILFGFLLGGLFSVSFDLKDTHKLYKYDDIKNENKELRKMLELTKKYKEKK